MWFLKAISCGMLLCLLGGCPRLGVCVTVTNASAQDFTVQLGEGEGCDQPPQVTRFTVRRLSDDLVMWNITSADGLPLSTVRYGEVPAGFNQGGQTQTLSPGDRVNITVDGRGNSGGVDVTVTDGP